MRIRTESGATYLLDRAALTIRRVGGEDSTDLRRDSEPLILWEWPKLQIGRSMILILQVRQDSVPTLRITSPVRSIETGPEDG